MCDIQVLAFLCVGQWQGAVCLPAGLLEFGVLVGEFPWLGGSIIRKCADGVPDLEGATLYWNFRKQSNFREK